MAAAADEQPVACPPTYRFRPTKRELVEFYLLPRARGQDPFPGVIIEDDAAGRTLPWDLLDRHDLGSEDQAYFLVCGHDSDAAAKKHGARQDRRCDGGVGAWKMQNSHDKDLRVRGETITCRVGNLNLHMGKGKKSGSVGWVMHEYIIVAPPCPSPVKICHIAFTGHGRMRMRVPAGQHAFVDATAASSGSALSSSGSWATLDHSSSGTAYASGSGDQEPLHLVLTHDGIFPQRPLLDNAEQYPGLEEQVPTTEQQDIMVPPPELMVQEPTMAEQQQLSVEDQGFWCSIGIDVSAEHEQFWSLTGVQSDLVVPNIGVVPTTQQQDIMVPLPELMVQEPTMAEQQQLSAEDQEFWCSIGVDVSAEDQQFWSLTGVQSDLVVPNIGVVPDFSNTATGTLGGAALGGGSLIW